ncbi:GNAT family N-acetyltransferase [bacterium]|nr:GNAT family N-acetyltransferase [bacterium]
MPVQNLSAIFNPRRVALLGITNNPKSVGGIVLSNLVSCGFRGVVYPVTPLHESVMGIQCYPSLEDLPNRPDLAIVTAPAQQVPDIVESCGRYGIPGVIIMSAGFKEAGEEGKQRELEIKTIAAGFPGMRVLGPNCLGVIAPGIGFNASFAASMPDAGHIAFISQSGALCTSVLDWAMDEKIGFSYFISIGNAMDVDFADIIDFLGEDESTKYIILYIESVSRAREFMTAARAFARSKPIIVYKAGRFPRSAEVAASHTGALVSADNVYEAAFRRIGIARVYDIGDIFNCAELIGRQQIPSGPRLGIVTNAGGPGVMAADALIQRSGELAELSAASLSALNEILPPMWSHGNPVDVLGDARSKRIAKAVAVVQNDPGVDGVLVILTPQAMTDPVLIARAVAALKEGGTKPLLAAWIGGSRMREGMRILAGAGVAVYSTPEEAVNSFMTLVNYARNLKSLYETPKAMLLSHSLDRKALRERFRDRFAAGPGMLSEEASKTLLQAYGIPASMPLPASTAEAAVSCAEQLGFPVVLKIDSPDISHKSDVGGVILDVDSGAAVRRAYKAMLTRVREQAPEAAVRGITVQKMVSAGDSVEMILGIKQDPVFGTTIMAGYGGTTAELFSDITIGFPPLNERLARQMLESLTIWPLLRGYRGAPALAVDSLVEALIRLSYIAADFPEIQELDINPLLVGTDRVTALDARLLLREYSTDHDSRPYSHFALRPYPEELVSAHRVGGDTEVTLRPIRPEDEPEWMELLASCSRESIYMRFRYFFQWKSHEVATRYCYIDYDRELAIVAEIEENGRRRLIGVGRIVADPDHDTAEYAVLVADSWQDRGVGSLLTDTCIAIAADWGVKRMYAQTTTDNHRMIAMFKNRGFDIRTDRSSSTVDVELAL